jgi:hypothetical protein
MSRTTDEELRDDKRDAGDCVVCGAEADGIDAGRDGNPPVCGFCAKVRLDGGEPAAGTGGGRHAPAMRGSTTPERTFAHYCDKIETTVYSPRRRCPLKCYDDDP